MATLKLDDIEIVIDFHDLDKCGDILYGYQFLLNKKNIINPMILNEKWQNGVFITTECDFKECGVIRYFERIIQTKNSESYESLEPPIIYIVCQAWNEHKNYTIDSWKNATHHDGTKIYKEGFIESMVESWEKQIKLTFSLGNEFTITKNSYNRISLQVKTTTDVLQNFIDDLKSEFEEFKAKNLEKHLQLSR